MSRHGGPQIPIAPFQDWCKEQIRISLERAGGPSWAKDSYGAVTELADRLGVHVRILNRVLRGCVATSRNGRKGEFPTDTISRWYIEDLLARAEVDFYDLYPEFAGERDIVLDPDAWCRCCADFITPIGGVCPWCDQPVEVAA